MSRESYRIEIARENYPIRVRVSVEPRVVTHPSRWFATDQHADEYAAKLRDRTGYRIFDRRQGLVR